MKRVVWDSMLDADMNVRYWGHLCRRYSNRDKYSKIFLAAMTSGTVASWAIWSYFPILWQVLSAISAIIAVALPILNWQKSIETMADLRGKWAQLRNEYEYIWLERKNKNASQLQEEYRKIKERESELSQKESTLPYDEKLLNRCYEEVLKSRRLKRQ